LQVTSYHTGIEAEATEDQAADWTAGLPEALAAVGDRWSLAIVAGLLAGPQRFGELQETLPAISPNVLSQRLRALQDLGLLLATPYSERPPRFLYELTGAGEELAGPVRLLGDWGARRIGAYADPPRHQACETPLELRWHCRACDEPVDAPAPGPERDVYMV
jgi:DNA-binding HxlR family transcriptional regulator